MVKVLYENFRLVFVEYCSPFGKGMRSTFYARSVKFAIQMFYIHGRDETNNLS